MFLISTLLDWARRRCGDACERNQGAIPEDFS